MGTLVKLAGKCLNTVAVWTMRAFAFIWKGFAGYCDKHNYKPKRVVCTLLVVILIAVGTATASAWIERQKAVTSGLGLLNIGELATQAYHYRSVDTIEKSQELWGWDVPLTKAESIFSYEGLIKAGYDFEDIEMEVDYGDKKIVVRLPEPITISNEIMSDSLLVYSEDTNIFTPIKIEDFNDTQAEMKAQGETDAVEIGLYESARTNAEMLIKGFLSGAFDLNEFEVVFE